MEVLFCIAVVMWALHNAQYYSVFQPNILSTIALGIGVSTRDAKNYSSFMSPFPTRKIKSAKTLIANMILVFNEAHMARFTSLRIHCIINSNSRQRTD